MTKLYDAEFMSLILDEFLKTTCLGNILELSARNLISSESRHLIHTLIKHICLRKPCKRNSFFRVNYIRRNGIRTAFKDSFEV